MRKAFGATAARPFAPALHKHLTRNLVDASIDQGKYRRQFAADVPAADAAVMAATQRPVSTFALEDKAGEAAWKTVSSRALVATADKNVPPAAERWMARRAGSHITEVDASHAVPVSRPTVVTDVILDAARSTH
ncbi:alpha/beta fold hydrolase [Streptomyces sp. NPDC058872]|uniref:alpha/beta fold hydrolase n=1 Tax=Streptomyces sp. NPDC058872 TaxID=3346661 RepID=UPI0036B2FAA8